MHMHRRRIHAQPEVRGDDVEEPQQRFHHEPSQPQMLGLLASRYESASNNAGAQHRLRREHAASAKTGERDGPQRGRHELFHQTDRHRSDDIVTFGGRKYSKRNGNLKTTWSKNISTQNGERFQAREELSETAWKMAGVTNSQSKDRHMGTVLEVEPKTSPSLMSRLSDREKGYFSFTLEKKRPSRPAEKLVRNSTVNHPPILTSSSPDNQRRAPRSAQMGGKMSLDWKETKPNFPETYDLAFSQTDPKDSMPNSSFELKRDLVEDSVERRQSLRQEVGRDFMHPLFTAKSLGSRCIHQFSISPRGDLNHTEERKNIAPQQETLTNSISENEGLVSSKNSVDDNIGCGMKDKDDNHQTTQSCPVMKLLESTEQNANEAPSSSVCLFQDLNDAENYWLDIPDWASPRAPAETIAIIVVLAVLELLRRLLLPLRSTMRKLWYYSTSWKKRKDRSPLNLKTPFEKKQLVDILTENATKPTLPINAEKPLLDSGVGNDTDAKQAVESISMQQISMTSSNHKIVGKSGIQIVPKSDATKSSSKLSQRNSELNPSQRPACIDYELPHESSHLPMSDMNSHKNEIIAVSKAATAEVKVVFPRFFENVSVPLMINLAGLAVASAFVTIYPQQ